MKDIVEPGQLAVDEAVHIDLRDLRKLFAQSDEPKPEIRNPHLESRVSEATRQSAKPSSVLILITEEPQPRVLLTKRQIGIRFGGHLCFPGGRADPGEGVIATALRESEEEIGLPQSQVEVLGSYGHYYTQAGFRIDPIVGIVDRSTQYAIEPSEVASIHYAQLGEMLDPAAYVMKSMHATRGYFGFDTGEVHIGGPTVSLMIGLLEWVSNQLDR